MRCSYHSATGLQTLMIYELGVFSFNLKFHTTPVLQYLRFIPRITKPSKLKFVVSVVTTVTSSGCVHARTMVIRLSHNSYILDIDFGKFGLPS